MKKLFLTSDLHFGHENIIRYCDRPFKSVRHMNEAMIERWNARVHTEDIVLFLGDFAMGRGVTPDYVVEIIDRLNGHKEVVMGNHDAPSKWSIGLRKTVEDANVASFIFHDSIYDFQHDGVRFIACHYPMVDWDGKYNGSIHLHGHTHTRCNAHAIHQMKQGRSYDIGVDMYGGPVELTGDLRYLNDPKGWA